MSRFVRFIRLLFAMLLVGCGADVRDVESIERGIATRVPPIGNAIETVDGTDVGGPKAAGGLGTLIYDKTLSVGTDAWSGVALTPEAGYSYVAIVAPTSGNPDAYAFGYTSSNGSFRFLRGSAFYSDTGTFPRDETHVFLSDLRAGEQGALMVYGQTAAQFALRIYRRKDVPLALPLSNYNAYSVPVSAVMDNSIGQVDVMTLYDGTVLKRANGCVRYMGSGNYRACVASDVANSNGSVVLGFRRDGGGAVMTDINYQAGAYPEFGFYDEHTGTDFALLEKTAVYAPMGGTMTVLNDAWNTIVIDHGDGWQTYFLHMIVESRYQWTGRQIGKGYRIGSIGGTGGVAPHLHFTVKKSGVRIDPYKIGLWRA